MTSTKARTYAGMAGLLAAGVVAGGILAGSLTASAADSTTSPTPSASVSQDAETTNPNSRDPSKPQRSDETLLTGATAAKVKAAVSVKYPGATFVRIETDSDGVYEAHITKADGSDAIVQLDKTFAITGEDQGGGGHRGGNDNDADDA